MATDKVAIVTGGSKGLGAALCEQLRERGYSVLEVSRTGHGEGSIHADLADPIEATKAVHEALESAVRPGEVGEFVCVINAATLGPVGPVARTSAPAMMRSLQVNFLSAVALMTTIIAMLQELPGRKVPANITSGAALTAYPGLSHYGAAKAGLEHFVRTVALEQSAQVHPFVSVNVDPGAMDTEMQATLRATSPEDYPEVGEFQRRHEAGQLLPPAEAARRIATLLSSQSLTPGARYHVRDLGPAAPATGAPAHLDAGAPPIRA